MRYLFLILQTNMLVLARKRGVRQPRQMYSSGRTLEIETNAFEGQSRSERRILKDVNQESEGDEPMLSLAYRKTGRTGGGNKAMGSKRSTSRGSSGKSPSMVPISLNIPPRNLPNLCKVKSRGAFGTERGNKYIISYIYQLEVEPGTTLQQLEEVIIPSIEAATVNFLIPHMFEPLCGSFRRLQLGLLQPGETRYLGISTMPVDIVSENGKLCVKCSEGWILLRSSRQYTQPTTSKLAATSKQLAVVVCFCNRAMS